VLPYYNITPGKGSTTPATDGPVLEMKGVPVRYNRDHDPYNFTGEQEYGNYPGKIIFPRYISTGYGQPQIVLQLFTKLIRIGP
jgi:hypothetical protein